MGHFPYDNGAVLSENKQLPKGITYDKNRDQLAGQYKSIKLYRKFVEKDKGGYYSYTIARNNRIIGTFNINDIRDTYKFSCCPPAVIKKVRNKLYIFEIFHTEYKINDPPTYAPETLIVRRTVVRLNKNNTVALLNSGYMQFENVDNRHGNFFPELLDNISLHSSNVKTKVYSDNMFKINRTLFIRVKNNRFYVSNHYAFLNSRFVAVNIRYWHVDKYDYRTHVVIYDIKNNVFHTIINNKEKDNIFIKDINGKSIFYTDFVSDKDRKDVPDEERELYGTFYFYNVSSKDNRIARKKILSIKVQPDNYLPLMHLHLDREYLYVASNNKKYFALFKVDDLYGKQMHQLILLYNKKTKKMLFNMDMEIEFADKGQINQWISDKDVIKRDYGNDIMIER
jgi:hypothetical protein